MENLTFVQQLAITIIDKLVIGVLIVILGFFVNKCIEGYKSKQALFNEIAKQRVYKISELLSLMYEWEFCVRNMNRTIKDILLHFKDHKERQGRLECEVLRLHEDSRKEGERIHRILEGIPFWLGEELYRNCHSYYCSVKECMEIYNKVYKGEEEDINFKSLESKSEKPKQKILKIILEENLVDKKR